ncbi:MAG: type II toxin-antitoxin system VapC family toxin [Myxococcales bacterium]|nr:type II toxin-antitoxin system VapC family toxin [Myxococcales bacterium]
MKYVLDASVAVAAVRPTEPHHRAARRRLAALLTGQDEIVVPAIFEVEVTSALVRAGVPPVACASYLATDLACRQQVTLGPRAVRGIVAVVATPRLRAADAAYVWVASTRGLPLVTLDREIAPKVAGLCRVEPP